MKVYARQASQSNERFLRNGAFLCAALNHQWQRVFDRTKAKSQRAARGVTDSPIPSRRREHKRRAKEVKPAFPLTTLLGHSSVGLRLYPRRFAHYAVEPVEYTCRHILPAGFDDHQMCMTIYD